jgi:cell division protein FtsB
MIYSNKREWLEANLDGYRKWYEYYNDLLKKEMLQKRACQFHIAKLNSRLKEITKKGQDLKKQIELLDIDSD